MQWTDSNSLHQTGLGHANCDDHDDDGNDLMHWDQQHSILHNSRQGLLTVSLPDHNYDDATELGKYHLAVAREARRIDLVRLCNT